ncbi:MAG: hypothetical protein HQK53_02975 [Oligoflexia bacterium]|nr:hypothetical protein [Oligoflexia bacterium]
MKKLIFAFFCSMLMGTSFSVNAIVIEEGLPTEWSKYLTTDKNDKSCEIGATFYVLKDSPFAYLTLNSGEKVPMYNYKNDSFTPTCVIKHYESISLEEGLRALPTYELVTTCEIMSSLPQLTVSYSGRRYSCDMTWVGL